MKIRIKNLKLKTIIGVHPRERRHRQKVVLNIEMDGRKAVATDDIAAAVDYRAATKSILGVAESSRFFLLESLAACVLDLLMKDGRIRSAVVEADKPGALRHAESVSVTMSGSRPAERSAEGRPVRGAGRGSRRR
jgi:D-erythro-7,8-dihydroneopterin triphosphate epimerase